ncbi:hypothetical protein O9993_15645 [Vibrio lentus]|nr:hypothetical protein [Vibrio lentus]
MKDRGREMMIQGVRADTGCGRKVPRRADHFASSRALPRSLFHFIRQNSMRKRALDHQILVTDVEQEKRPWQCCQSYVWRMKRFATCVWTQTANGQ